VGTTNTRLQANNGGLISLVSTTCTGATITGNGGATMVIYDSGTNVPPGQPSGPTGTTYTATQNPGPGCGAVGVYTFVLSVMCPANITAQTNVDITVDSLATTGLGSATGGGGGSMGAGLPFIPGSATNGVRLVCLPANPQGNLAASTIAIKKVDQFGQPVMASFSIQQGPFRVEVARVNLGSTVAQNPCATDGTTGLWPVGSLPAGSGTSCTAAGVISPAVFATGLPAGQYRVVEIGPEQLLHPGPGLQPEPVGLGCSDSALRRHSAHAARDG
jgi:hypothetical protein